MKTTEEWTRFSLACLGLVAILLLGVRPAQAMPLLQFLPSDSPLYQKLQVVVTPERDAYELGELVRIRIELRNLGETPIVLPQSHTAENGGVLLFVADESGAFKAYYGPNWHPGNGLIGQTTLPPGGSVASATVLYWNRTRPKPSDFAPLQREQHEREYVTTPCAFWRTGSYQIKAGFRIPGAPREMVSSEPAALTIKEPTGAQRKLWRYLKAHPEETAFFLHSGDLNDSPRLSPGANSQMIDHLRRIAEETSRDSRLDWVRQRIAGFDQASSAKMTSSQ